MADLVLTDVDKVYDNGFHAVKDLSLQVEDGEFLVLVGPSGCGKTTALRMVAGLEDITDGTIAIGGKVVNDVSPRDRNIAMVFQSYALYPHMTVGENIGFGLALRHEGKAEIKEKVDRAGRLLDLTSMLTRKPKQLSGGQRQRVAMGRAIVRDAELFLMDEPLSNLDAKLRVQMRAEIAAMQRDLEITTVYVTHDQVEAMTMGHRIAVLHAGKLQQCGTPLEVYERPANLFVAAFIGSPPMNFVKTTVAGGGTRLEAPGVSLPVPSAHRAALAGKDGQGVVVGVRPEHVVPPGQPARGETAPVAVTVEIAEPLGDEVVVHARAGEFALVFKQDPHTVSTIGEPLEVRLELAALHLFDATTELRLGA